MSKLEAAGYVQVDKAFADKRPKTLLRLTAEGRAAFERYVARMKRLLAEVEASSGAPARTKLKARPTRQTARALKPQTT